jgi:glycosyltransferase involved in cell wall biosynthesis
MCYNRKPRFAFVVPRYGDGQVGGAETLARLFAEQLVSRQLADVSVLTTCTSDLNNWTNDLPQGLDKLNGVNVLRFPIDHARRNHERWLHLHNLVTAGTNLSPTEQFEWVEHHYHAPELYWHLYQNRTEYDLYFFIPYLYGTSYYGSMVNPSRSIAWPCLHNEPTAYLAPTRLMLQQCRGIIFNSAPEQELAVRLRLKHMDSRVVGVGIKAPSADAERFRRKYDIDTPFILYVGRLVVGKGVDRLLDLFARVADSLEPHLQLVLAGFGGLSIPDDPRVRVLGFLPEQDKFDAMAAATALVHPSLNESLAMVLFEAWLSGTPVIVRRACAVTNYHVERSGGGFAYATEKELRFAIQSLVQDPALRERLARNGGYYTRTYYNWDNVIQYFVDACEVWMSDEPQDKRDNLSSSPPVSPSSMMRALRDRVLENDPTARQELGYIAHLATLQALVTDVERASNLREFEFTSSQPILGPFLSKVRSAVNEIATKWVVRALIQQQNQFNAVSVHALHEVVALNQWLLTRVLELEDRVAELEREKHTG